MLAFLIALLFTLGVATVVMNQNNHQDKKKLSKASNHSKRIEIPQYDQGNYLLPQKGFVEGSDWQKISHSMFLNDEKPYLVPWYDWRGQMKAQCSFNNAPIAPRTPQDCPDSSYTYVTDMSKFIPGAKPGIGGCIQLGEGSQNFCYSDPEGKYHPWWDKINVTSP